MPSAFVVKPIKALQINPQMAFSPSHLPPKVRWGDSWQTETEVGTQAEFIGVNTSATPADNNVVDWQIWSWDYLTGIFHFYSLVHVLQGLPVWFCLSHSHLFFFCNTVPLISVRLLAEQGIIQKEVKTYLNTTKVLLPVNTFFKQFLHEECKLWELCSP